MTGPLGKAIIKGALTLKNLKLPIQSVPSKLIYNLNSEKKIPLKPYKNAEPKILIGQDNWKLIVSRELFEYKHHDLAASRSLLGWTLQGNNSGSTGITEQTLCLKGCVCINLSCETGSIHLRELDELIKNYFNIDSIGININNHPKNSHERALSILASTTRKRGIYWETGLLWKADHPPEVNSYQTALKRLKQLEQKLARDSEYACMYTKEMERFIELGYATKVDRNLQRSRVWYLPHFGVRKKDKPGKLRLVFDAAAKTNGISLNDQLEVGPDLLQSLTGIIMRFRQHEIAIKGDITDMFLRVKIREKDRGAQRFLWRGSIYEMTTLIFGSTASPCSAQYVKNTNAKCFLKQKPRASKSIEDDSYMDDYLKSCATEEEAIELVNDVTKINKAGGFEMHGWASNCATVVPHSGKGEGKSHETKIGDRGGEKVLGLYWDTQTDELRFNVAFDKISPEIMNGSKTPTKREVLRVIMSIFDPLGLLAPFTMRSKMLLQQIWRSAVRWDEKIKDDENKSWLSWINKLKCLKCCKVPRCLSPLTGNVIEIELHTFCDASLLAYAAVTYLRYRYENDLAHVALLTSKNKIAPIKPMTIPRLELQAALIGARLAKYVEEQMSIKISRRIFWSDSSTVLCWIRSEPRTKQIFVSNRLGEISEITKIPEWHWVPTKENPADDATRLAKTDLHENRRWFEGPDFLSLPESEWPIEKTLTNQEKSDINAIEEKKLQVCVIITSPEKFTLVTRLLGWRGLLNVAERIRKLCSRWRGGRLLSAQGVDSNENYWFRVIQVECFGNEIKALNSGKTVSNKSKIISLNPFLDGEGILRCNGRATLATGFNNEPIILDAKHVATRSLISEFHRNWKHGSNNTVLNEIRQRFYIIGLRNALKSIVSRCLTCRKRRGIPKNPLMGALPAGRLAHREKPFAHCGMDYFGPMMVKIGRRREKRWGVLFTCLTVRAVHIELASKLDADSAIMALQRLAARRGTPVEVYSDNGSNFHAASKELRETIRALDIQKIANFATLKRFKWHFNSPDSAHQGGAWEVLVRSVKTALNAMLKDQAPFEEVLLTALIEAEHSVNSRPLTDVSLDPRDDEALTPNHFLIGSSSGSLNMGRYEEQNICLRRRYKIAQQYAEVFWKRWLREYLPTLLPRKKWFTDETSLEVGDLVMIVDLTAPRNIWRIGTITQTFPGRDGITRVAKIHTPKGDFVRPMQRLIMILKKNEV